MWITFLDAGGGIYYTNSNYMVWFESTKLIRVGNSLAVVIPIHILRELLIFRGDTLVVGVSQNNIICLRKMTDEEILQVKPDVMSIT